MKNLKISKQIASSFSAAIFIPLCLAGFAFHSIDKHCATLTGKALPVLPKPASRQADRAKRPTVSSAHSTAPSLARQRRRVKTAGGGAAARERSFTFY